MYTCSVPNAERPRTLDEWLSGLSSSSIRVDAKDREETACAEEEDDEETEARGTGAPHCTKGWARSLHRLEVFAITGLIYWSFAGMDLDSAS